MKKTTLKLLAFLTAVVLAASAFSACGVDPNVKQEDEATADYKVKIDDEDQETERDGYYAYGKGKTDPVKIGDVTVNVKDYAVRSYELGFMMAQKKFDKPKDIPLEAAVQYAFIHVFYDDFYSQVFQGNLENIKNLIFPNNKPQNATAFRYIYDTTINDIAYKILQRISLKYFYNQETKKFDIPNELQIDYYYNTASKRLEYIKETPTSRKRNRAWPEEYYVNYYFDADTTGWYTTFDRSSPRYASYSQGTDSEPVGYSSLSMQGNESLTDSVKKFPIVSLYNDTTNIAKQDGWILLDFWFSGCTGCIKWFHTLGKEKETLGYRILEQNGIKIMCINCLSDNVNYLSQKANDSRSQIPDIMYHAKGIGKILDMHVMPQYYLISPDKQIVYKSHDLGDYSELLQAKTEYEKKLQ